MLPKNMMSATAEAAAMVISFFNQSHLLLKRGGMNIILCLCTCVQNF